MKKVLTFSLTMVLMLVLSAGVCAAGDDLGPKLNTIEGYVAVEIHGPEISVGARKWMGDTSYGQYAVGGEVDYKLGDWSTSGLGLYGKATWDWTEYVASYFNPGQVFTKHGVNIHSSFGMGYVISGEDDQGGFDWEWAQEFTYPVSEDLDVALRFGEGLGVSASMNF